MIRHSGGQQVGKGTYWSIRDGQRIDIEKEGTLPGDRQTRYHKVPAGIMLLLGPVLGLLYVIALPFIAIGTVVVLGGGKILGSLLQWLRSIATFGWKPTEAYLAGKKRKKEKKN